MEPNKKFAIALIIGSSLMGAPKKKCLKKSSSLRSFKGTSAFYNHFVIDDRVAPGRVWNEEFTSGIR